MSTPGSSTQRLRAALAAVALLGLAAVATAGPAGAASAAGASAALTGVSNFNAVACASASACVAVGNSPTDSGKSAAINGSTSKTTVWVGQLKNQPLWSVACQSATTCLAVALGEVVTVNTTTAAMKLTAAPPVPTGGIVAMSDIACASSTACYAVGFEGSRPNTNAMVIELSGAGKYIKTIVDTGTGSGAIACPTATECLLSDYVAPVTSIQVFSGGKIGSPHAMPANTYVQAIRCFQAQVCYALAGNSSTSQTNEMVPLNPTTGVPGTPITIGGGFTADGFACPSATSCVLAGFVGSGSTAKPATVVVNKGVPAAPVFRAGSSLSSVACASVSNCYAVGLGKSSAVVEKVYG